MAEKSGTVFVSWSGRASQRVAEVFGEGLPHVVGHVDTFVSSKDICLGHQWRTSIDRSLERSTFGIMCLTRSNLRSPWIHFEAGAIANSPKCAGICCYLIDVSVSEVEQPLSAYQNQEANEKGTWSLIRQITRQFSQREPQKFDEEIQKYWYKAFWKMMNEAIGKAAIIEPDERHEPPRSADSKLDELLNLVRSISAEIQSLPEGRKGLSSISERVEEALGGFDRASAPEIEFDPIGEDHGRFYRTLSEYIEDMGSEDEIWIMSNHRLRTTQAVGESSEREQFRERYFQKLVERAKSPGKYFRVMCFPELPKDGAIQKASLKPWLIRHALEIAKIEKDRPEKVLLRIGRQVFAPDVLVVPKKLAVLSLDVTDTESQVSRTHGMLIFRYPTCRQVVDYLAYVVKTAWHLGQKADWCSVVSP